MTVDRHLAVSRPTWHHMRFSTQLRFSRLIALGWVVALTSWAVAVEHPWQPPGTVEITESVVAFMRSDESSDQDRTVYGNAILGSFSSLEKAENAVIEKVEALAALLKKVMIESDQLSLEQMRQLQEACERVASAQEQAARAYERFPAAATAAVHAAEFSDRAKAKNALAAMLDECRLSFAAAWHRADAGMHRRMANLLEEARTAVAPHLVISELGRPRDEANERKKNLEAAFVAGKPLAP